VTSGVTGDDAFAEPHEDSPAGPPQFPDDPLHGLVLDDTFVAQARFRESAAVERIAQAQRIAGGHEARGTWRGVDHTLAKRRLSRRRRRWGRAVPALVAVLVVTTVVVWRPGMHKDLTATQLAAATDGPPLTRTRSTTRTLPAPVVPLAGTSYAFVSGPSKADGSPRLTWNPCEPIHYVIRGRGTPGNGRALVTRALAEASAVSGLAFQDDGDTIEDPDDLRAPYQPGRYGSRWAPVLIVWSDEQESPHLAGDVAGYATTLDRREPGRAAHYVSGQVVLDTPTLTRLPDASAEAVVQHEVGHLLGLDHVEDTTQLMNPSSSPGGPETYADGDRHGLALLGSGACD
jgi:hypothetical protein